MTKANAHYSSTVPPPCRVAEIEPVFIKAAPLRGALSALPPGLDTEGELLLPDDAVPFPRGFGFGDGGQLYLSSGIGPSGEGDNTITMFERDGRLRNTRLVSDPYTGSTARQSCC